MHHTVSQLYPSAYTGTVRHFILRRLLDSEYRSLPILNKNRNYVSLYQTRKNPDGTILLYFKNLVGFYYYCTVESHINVSQINDKFQINSICSYDQNFTK